MEKLVFTLDEGFVVDYFIASYGALENLFPDKKEEIIKRFEDIYKEQVRGKGLEDIFNHNVYSDPEIFDRHSYSFFKAFAEYVKDDDKRIRFTEEIGEYFFKIIKKSTEISIMGPNGNNFEKIKHNISEIISYLKQVAYFEDAKVDWTSFDKEKLENGGTTSFTYTIKNPVIYESARQLFNEEGFAQHYSTRIIQAALKEFGIHGKEEKKFNLLEFFSNNIKEKWELRKI